MESQEPIVTLVGEDGEEFEFVILDTFFVDDKEYAILAPLEDDEGEENEEEAVVFRIEEDDEGNQVLIAVEEDEEWQKVADVWDSRIQEEESD
ncbi:MAG: DUF1292 domain-containing protein [Firmicutes bacterium]|nr:DUF1292 domain-containing protein [Bacillota bacterium]